MERIIGGCWNKNRHQSDREEDSMKKNRVFALITVLLGSLLMGCASGGKKTDVIRQESTAAAQTDYPDEDEMTIT